MKKFLAYILSIIIVVTSVFVSGVSAFAESMLTITDANGEIVYTDELSQTPANEIINAFRFCESYVSDDNIYTINMPAGSYVINKTIFPCDNTVFKMEDETVLINDMDSRGNIFCSKQNVTKYNGLKNFTVIGGTVTYSPTNQNGSVLFRFAHCKNILIKNVTFKNGYKSHFSEVGACQNVTYDGCTFSGFTGSLSSSSCEALQIDILEETTHFANMPEYDGTMNSGIYVTNCKFENLIAGVGTNNVFVGYYQDKIYIKNNTFTNISGTAINAFGFTNCEISNNTITKCGVGIRYYMMKNDDALNKASILNNNGKINTSCKSVIKNNKISTIKTKDVSKSTGIIVLGNNVTAQKTSVVKAGNYAVNGLKVTNNTITTKEEGINVYDTLNSTFSGNVIKGPGSLGRGISFDKNSKNNTVSSNKISNFKNAIYTNDSSGISFSSNTLSTCSSSSMAFNGKSTSMSVTSNTISSGSSNAIYVSANSSVKSVKNNTFSNMKGFGCFFEKGASGSVGYNKLSKVTKAMVGVRTSNSKVVSSGNVSAPSITLKKTKSGAELSWKKPSGTFTYTINRKKSTEKSYSKIGSISASKKKYTDKKVKKKSKYSYQVVSNKKIGNVTVYSNASKTKTVTI